MSCSSNYFLNESIDTLRNLRESLREEALSTREKKEDLEFRIESAKKFIEKSRGDI